MALCIKRKAQREDFAEPRLSRNHFALTPSFGQVSESKLLVAPSVWSLIVVLLLPYGCCSENISRVSAERQVPICGAVDYRM